MSFDSAADIKRIALDRSGEASDGSSDLDSFADDVFIEVWRDLVVRHPWLCLVKSPPAAFLTAAPLTTLTLTVAAAGVNVAATLSSVVSTSLVGAKAAPTGGNYFARITAHSPPSANVTLDAAPSVLAAAACVVYQDEYDLASRVGTFVDGLWTPEKADPVVLWSEERMKTELGHGAAVAGFPPAAFARLSKTRIRLSSYPTVVRRLEYAYSEEVAAPATTSAVALVLDESLRATLLTGCLGLLYKEKLDRRFQVTVQSYERRIQKAMEYETRLRTAILGRRSGATARSVWDD